MPTATATTHHDASFNSLVCPFIADVAFDSQLNVTTSVTEVVSIANIQHVFNSSDMSGDLASFFQCNGWSINRNVAQAQAILGDLEVDLCGSGLRNLLALAVGSSNGSATPLTVDVTGTGQKDASGATLYQYLRNQYHSAFSAAFPDYEYDVSGNDEDAQDAGTLVTGAAVGTGAADSGELSAQGASVVTQTAQVFSYNFEIDVSGGAAAANMIAGLVAAEGGGNNYLNSLFMQLDYNKRIIGKTNASGTPTDTKLPLETGDSITFVFDININASTNTSSSLTNSNIISPPALNPATGVTDGVVDTAILGNGSAGNNISMDLGTRRVAFVLYQGTTSPIDDYTPTNAATSTIAGLPNANQFATA